MDMKASIYITLIIGLILCISSVSAFDPNDYLYKNENKSWVAIENFTFSNINYQLVKVGGTEIFLLKGGEPVKNQDEITAAIHYYYAGKYGPSQTDLTNIKTLLNSYNASRNDGGRWKGQEENICRKLLLLNGVLTENSKGVYCTTDNEAGCERIGGALYYSAGHTQNIKQVVPFKEFYISFKEYAFSTNTIETKMTLILDKVDDITDENIKETLTFISQSIPSILDAEVKIESTVFRTPRAGDKEDLELCKDQNNNGGCFAVCPDFSYNDTQLNEAKTKIDGLLSKVTPLADYKTVSANLLQNTNDRIMFRAGEDNAKIYLSKFAPLKTYGLEAIKSGDNTLIYVNDPEFKSKLDQFKELNNKINTSITKRNFSTIDEDMQMYASMSEYVMNQSIIVLSVYNETINSKNTLDALIFAAESKKTLPLEMEEELGDILNQSFVLNSQFSKGLTPQEYENIKGGYMNLTSELAGTMQKQQEFVAFSKFRSLARKINGGVYDMAVSSAVLKPDVLSANAAIIPPAIAIVSWISLSALLLFAYIAFFSWIRPQGGIVYIYYVILIFLLGAIIVFSSGLYLYLKGTTTNADLQEFLIGMEGEQNVSIILEMEGASADAQNSMKNCANKLKTALAEDNRTATIYLTKASLGCSASATNNTAGDANITECALHQNEPKFVFQYSTVQSKPSFSAIFEKKAYMSGDGEYYDACQIAAVFE
jgi:hypothetical protein